MKNFFYLERNIKTKCKFIKILQHAENTLIEVHLFISVWRRCYTDPCKERLRKTITIAVRTALAESWARYLAYTSQNVHYRATPAWSSTFLQTTAVFYTWDFLPDICCIYLNQLPSSSPSQRWYSWDLGCTGYHDVASRRVQPVDPLGSPAPSILLKQYHC
jgi:hypothetical protein